jgi:integrase
MPKHLVRRGQTWSVRYVVPRKYRELIGRESITKSTGERDVRAAERASHRVLTELADMVERLAAQTSLTTETDAADLARQVAAGDLDYDTAVAVLTSKFEDLAEGVVVKNGRRYVRTPAEEPQPTAQLRGSVRAALAELRGQPASTLKACITRYRKHQEARGLRGQTVDGQVRSVELFADWFGEDRDVSEIDRRSAAQFVAENIMTLAVRSRDPQKEPRPASAKTKAEHIGNLVTFMNWLTRSGLYDHANPFAGQKEHIAGTKRATDNGALRRRPWAADELKKLAALPEGDALRDVGLLSLWLGLRTNEAASLAVADVHTADGYLVVREGKNENARRYLPIHSAILPAVGRMVDRATAAKRELLFDLKPGGRDKKLAHGLSKRAGRFIRESVSNDPALVFYSLRHTHATALERAGVDLTMRQRLMGHRPSDMTSGTYSSGPQLEQMRAAVELIGFPIR